MFVVTSAIAFTPLGGQSYMSVCRYVSVYAQTYLFFLFIDIFNQCIYVVFRGISLLSSQTVLGKSSHSAKLELLSWTPHLIETSDQLRLYFLAPW